MKTVARIPQRGMTLVEVMVSLGCGSVLLAAVLTSGVSLQRTFGASESYAISEGDQLRVSDYIALDCRRATAASIANNQLVLTLPVYYDSASSYQPATPTLASGVVKYKSGSVTVTYSKSGSNFNREVTVKDSTGTVLTDTTTAVATNVASFTVTPIDLTSSVSCNIMFFPTFRYQAGTGTWTSGTSAPDNSVGVDGDLYVVAPASDGSNASTVGNVYRRAGGIYGLLQNVKATNVYCNTFLRNASARQ